ncbi:unnamed protein product, partial [Dovyalis caffra]
NGRVSCLYHTRVDAARDPSVKGKGIPLLMMGTGPTGGRAWPCDIHGGWSSKLIS